MPITVEKPAGLPVFPLHADPHSDCVLARLLANEPERREMPWPVGFSGGIAHRLDISTSGAIWVASDPEELGRMRAAFAQGRLEKTYRFVSKGSVPWSIHSVDLAIAHDRRKKKKMIVQRGKNTPHRGAWLPASTSLRRVRGDLWEAVMRSGVMHQIRVHCAFVGLPLAGDPLYGGGASPPQTPHGASFLLHHIGLAGDGWRTDPVVDPSWAV